MLKNFRRIDRNKYALDEKKLAIEEKKMALEEEKGRRAIEIEVGKLKWQRSATILQGVAIVLQCFTLIVLVWGFQLSNDSFKDSKERDFKRLFFETKLRNTDELINSINEITYAKSAKEERDAADKFWPAYRKYLLVADQESFLKSVNLAEFLMKCQYRLGHVPGLHWPSDKPRGDFDATYCNSPTLNSYAVSFVIAARNSLINTANKPLQDLDVENVFPSMGMRRAQ